MARRPTPTQRRMADLTPVEMRQGIARLQKRVDTLEALDPAKVTRQYHEPEIDSLAASIDEALQRTFGPDTEEYNRYSSAAFINTGPVSYMQDTPLHVVQEAVRESKARNLALLQQAIGSLEERLEEAGEAEPAATGGAGPRFDLVRKADRSAFVVHGHDEAARETVARFLEKIGFKPIILHEQANKGRTIIEKFEAHADVGFAVILLTPDDQGGPKAGELSPRARQNVVLELGYFLGRLGRERVCALRKGDTEIPSDYAGVVYEPFDSGGAWKSAVARELEAVGYEIDWNTVMRP